MAAVRIILYIFSALFMLSLVFVFLPWEMTNGLTELFGAEPFPTTPLVIYSMKSFLFFAFWLGVLLAMATRHPLAHEKVLLVFGGLGVTFAVVSLGLGWTYGLGAYFYGDVASSLVLGALALVYRRHALAEAGAG